MRSPSSEQDISQGWNCILTMETPLGLWSMVRRRNHSGRSWEGERVVGEERLQLRQQRSPSFVPEQPLDQAMRQVFTATERILRGAGPLAELPPKLPPKPTTKGDSLQ
jgi:hypothetical protein